MSLSEEEELELLELEEAEAQARAKAKPQEKKTSAWGAAGRGAIQGASMDFGDEIWGGLRAIGDALPESLGGEKGSFTERYVKNRDAVRRANAQAEAEHPGAYLGGSIAGGLASALVPVGTAAKGAGILAKAGAPLRQGLGQAMGRSAATGGGLGLVSGLGRGEGDAGSQAASTLKGGLGGLLLGGGLPVVARGAQGLLRGVAAIKDAVVRGVIEPSQAAQLLEQAGVDNLTLGQMAPDSALAQLEEVGKSAGGIGSRIREMRQAAAEKWQDAVMREAAPPGTPGLSGGTAQEKAAGLHEGFKQAYEGVRDSPLSARAQARPTNVVRLKKALGLAAEDPSVLATADDIAATSRFLENQATMAERAGATPEVLMSMRSNIRERIRGLAAGDPKRELLSRAEESVTNRLRYALPGEALESLRATDAQYGKYKTLERALAAAGDSPNGFTPAQLSQAIRQGADKGSYARGAGGTMRELAAAGREVIEPKIPMTGVQSLMSMGPLPNWLTAPAMYTANLPGPKAALLGRTAWQQALQDAGSSPAAQKTAALVAALRQGGNSLSPIAASVRAFSPAPESPLALMLREEEERQRLAGY